MRHTRGNRIDIDVAIVNRLVDDVVDSVDAVDTVDMVPGITLVSMWHVAQSISVASDKLQRVFVAASY